MTAAGDAARLADLERRLADMEAELSVYRNNGLRDLYTGHGFQEYGGGIMRLDSSGLQIKSNEQLTPERAAIWFLSDFAVGSPGDGSVPFGYIEGTNAPGIGSNTVKIGVDTDADESAYFQASKDNTQARLYMRAENATNGVTQFSIVSRAANVQPLSVRANLGSAGIEIGGAIAYEHESGVSTVSNTTTETAIASYSVPAKLLGIARGLRATVGGTYLNNDGAARNLTIRVKFGSTTMYADTISPGNSANTRAWRLQVEMFNAGATNDQRMVGHWRMSSTNTPTTGFGDLEVPSGAAGTTGVIAGSAAEDTTSAKTFSITVEHGTASSNLSITRTVGVLELL